MGPLWRTEFDASEWIEHHLRGPSSDFRVEQTRPAMTGRTRLQLPV